ncbi:DUF6463 family protein [Kribbella catacumbae]|uniref:DUF6463 family protein n=1 Tax=Kribbella catacumbae TaxID=460086 RepID=UPI00037FD7EC|nr:DUF6463 family protein [Kribbella catacumbae]
MNRLVWVPRALYALAALHTVAAVTDKEWLDIIDHGVVGAAAADDLQLRAESGFSLYFLTTGILMFAVADLAASHLKATGTLPARLGWYVLALGSFITVVHFPINGGWLVVMAGVAMLVLDRRHRSSSSRMSTSRSQGEARASSAHDLG